MSALALADAGRGWEDAGRRDEGAEGTASRPAQPRLFALPGGAVVDAPPAEVAPAAPPTPTAAVVAPVRTLDDVLGDAWRTLGAGSTAVCPVCDGPLRPRWSAGAGAVGGRCGDCGTVVE